MANLNENQPQFHSKKANPIQNVDKKVEILCDLSDFHTEGTFLSNQLPQESPEKVHFRSVKYVNSFTVCSLVPYVLSVRSTCL